MSPYVYVCIDVNSGNLEGELLELIWDKLSPGAMVFLDDYGFESYKNLPIVVDQFLSNKSEEIFELPNKTGFILKN